MCNADLKFINIVASWPGSAHDSTIFNNSNLRVRFEHGEFPNCFLLGDSGYPLRDYFLTLLADGRGHQLYNEALIRTRILIERTIGIWKRRPIVAYGSRLKESTTSTVIILKWGKCQTILKMKIIIAPATYNNILLFFLIWQFC